MKKFIKRSLLLLLVLSSLSFTVAACNNGTGNNANVPPAEQTTPSDNQQPEEQQPDDKQPEEKPSEEQPTEQDKPSEEKPSEEQPTEQEKPTEDQPSQGGTKLPGGLVDMGNFESKQ